MKKVYCIILLNFAFNPTTHSQVLLETREPDSKYTPNLQQKKSDPEIKYINKSQQYQSVQVNTDQNGLNIVGDAANEPSLAVNPLNPNQIAVGWRQFDTVTNDFRQAGRSYSDDGGQTWNYQTVFEPGVFRSDPVLESNAEGHFYYQSLKVVGNSFNVDQWKSYDGGKTWVEKTFAYGGDKSWIAIDNTNGPGRGNIYAAWNVAGNTYFPNTFNSSLDNGISFTQPSIVPRKPVFGTVDVGPDGEVYIFGTSNLTSPTSTGTPYLVKSASPNMPQPTFDHVRAIDMRSVLSFRASINEEGLTGQMYVRVDKSNRPSRGNVYLMSSMRPLSGGDPLDIMFTKSTDQASTFPRARRINTDVDKNWQWFGTMSVAPNGRIDIIWYDTRQDDGSLGTIGSSRLFYTYSYDAGQTFAKEEAISPRFNNLIGYPIQRKMGDYIDMKSDNNSAHIIYSATYNNEQDVYYLNVKPSAVEENPDLPTLLVNNAWSAPGVPRQGILSSNLINNGNPENPILAFETIFTATPDGEPMWLVATGNVPLTGDSMTVPLFMPTGDLTDEGQALNAIGLLTKSRIRDENNELIDNRILYTFDTSDSVKQQVADLTGSQFNEEVYNSNPFYNITKTLSFNSLLPRNQTREDLCNINGQVLKSTGEKSEGRVQFTYSMEDKLHLFSADFTYKKNVDENGQETIVLDENKRATPTWEVIISNENGILEDNSNENYVFSPNGGLGFFEAGSDPGLTELGTESVTVSGSTLLNQKPNGATESMFVLTKNAYCGESIN